MMNRTLILMNLLFFLSVTVFLQSCKEDSDPTEEVVVSDTIVAVNKFIYGDMSTYYLWESQMPEFSEKQIEEQTDPYKFFDTLLFENIAVR